MAPLSASSSLPMQTMRTPVLAFSLCLLCLLTTMVYFLWASHQQAVNSAKINTDNLVQVLETRVAADFSRVDGILSFVADEVRTQGLWSRTPSESLLPMQKRLANLIVDFPAVAVLSIFDADGQLLLSSDPEWRPFSIADRPHFQRLRANPSLKHVFSDPLVARATGKWALVQSLAIRNADGELIGVVNALFHLDDLADDFAKLDVGDQGRALLRRSDNFQLIFRTPYSSVQEQDINQPIPPSNAVRRQIEAGVSAGSLRFIASTDARPRLASFRVLKKYPFYVQVALADEDYLADWYRQVAWVSVFAVVLMVLFVLFIMRMKRDEHRIAQANQALAYRQGLFSALFEQSSLMAAIVDSDGRLLEVNAQALTVLHGQRERVLGATLVDLPCWPQVEQQAALQRLLAQAIQGQLATIDHLNIALPDRQIAVMLHAIPVQLAEQRLVAVTAIDISALKASEAELQEKTHALEHSNAELEQFSYSISHDMRQPLRMISSYLQLLRQSLGNQLDEDQQQFCHFAIDGAKRLDAMLIGLLEYSRVGRKGEPPVWIESQEVLQQVLLFLQPMVRESGAQITVQGEWPRLFASPDELLRLLQNLIGNALKFRVAERVPHIEIRAVVGDGMWSVSIQDNGIGIMPEQAGRLFQMFQRLQSRSAYEGTGLGLAICRKIVEHHGGRLWVESAGEGLGSCFTFEIPYLTEMTLESVKENQ